MSNVLDLYLIIFSVCDVIAIVVLVFLSCVTQHAEVEDEILFITL